MDGEKIDGKGTGQKGSIGDSVGLRPAFPAGEPGGDAGITIFELAAIVAMGAAISGWCSRSEREPSQTWCMEQPEVAAWAISYAEHLCTALATREQGTAIRPHSSPLAGRTGSRSLSL